MDSGQPESVRAYREEVKRRYGDLFDEVSRILFRHDPMGINFGGNTDEYEPEAGTILPRLEDVSSEGEALDVIHQEFVGWFDPALAGSRDGYVDVAKDVWAAWQRHGARDRR